MKRKKGFTLIEILIVVIILAVLAAMILPRFMGQTENAFIAEAQQQLGVLRRAEINAVDMSGAATAAFAAGTLPNGIGALGLGATPETHWTYACTAWTGAAANAAAETCTATRVGGPNAVAGTITLDAAGNYTCTTYTQVIAGAANPRGCRA